MLDIGPSGNDGADHHQTKGEQSQGCDGAAKPKNLSVCDEDDGQVLEDGVDRDGQELKSPGTGVDHADEEERDGEPCSLSVWILIGFLRIGQSYTSWPRRR